MNQHTLRQPCHFCGTGLHTGCDVSMHLLPAPAGTGIVFERTDLGGAQIPALAAFVGSTQRSTCLSCEGAEVHTVEHLLSACAGLGIDNLRVQLDGPEVPILDGSAARYAAAFREAGLEEQNAPRREIVLREPFEFTAGESLIRFEPADRYTLSVEIDFRSQVIGVQAAAYTEGDDYAAQIAPCRTFCFLQEVEFLRRNNLIKGGSLDNALVIDEPRGYLNDTPLHFPNECARHKLLDLLGDLALAGARLRARVTAVKPGHSVNTAALRALLTRLNA